MAVLWLLSSHMLWAETTFRGTVTDARNGEAIPLAYVRVDNELYISITNQEGQFSLNLPPGKYQLQISSLGYKEVTTIIEVTDHPQQSTFSLQQQSLQLDNVDVIGRQKHPLSSSVTINDQAISYQQATNLADILSLLPGEPNKQEKALHNSIHAGIATTIIIDGQVIHNMGTMQHERLPANTNETNLNLALSHTGAGIDYRSISVDDIASIEVSQGISSVEYGDHTGKVIRIETKKGGRQLDARLQSNGYTRLASFNKGIQLKMPGSLRLNADYLSSSSDRRSPFTTYDRLNTRLSFSNCFMPNSTPLYFNLHIGYSENTDENKHDPDAMLPDEATRLNYKAWSFNTHGNWQLNKKWITRVDYQASAKLTNEESYTRNYILSQSPAATNYDGNGLHQGYFLPTEYIKEYWIDGAPRSYQAKLKASQNQKIRNGHHQFILGGEYQFTSNKGDGHRSLPYPSDGINKRQLTFSQLPPHESIVLFTEENLSFPIGQQMLNLSLGMRASNYQPRTFINSNLGWRYEPRIKAGIELINNSGKTLSYLNLRSGIGRFYQAPPLAYLYQSAKYRDYISLHYQDDDETNSAVWFTTVKTDQQPSINASYTVKKEIGMDVKWHSVVGHFTLYYNHNQKTFNNQRTAQWDEYKLYDASSIEENTRPDPSTLPFSTEKEINSQSYITNKGRSKELKFDYQLRLGKIKAISSEVIIDGTWRKTRAYSYQSVYVPIVYSANQAKGIGIYNDSPESKRQITFANSRLRLVTHLPKLRLLINSSLQYLQTNESLYYTFGREPILIEEADKEVLLTEELRSNPAYGHFIIPEELVKISEPDVLSANIKVTKEIGRYLQCSIFVDNFLNHRPFYKDDNGYSYYRQNRITNFGAELKIKL